MSKDTSSTWDVIRHTTSYLKQQENYQPDYIILLQPTTPFRTPLIIDKCIKKLIKLNLNSCITVTDVDYPPQWTYKLNKKNNLTKFLKGNYKWPLRRQDAEHVYQPNGMVYSLKTSLLKKKLPIPSNLMGYVFIEKRISCNIDSYHDLTLAKIIWDELQIEKRKNCL